MKQKIGTLHPAEKPVTDLDALFVALYNLLYEKLEKEPNKGIVVCKGEPCQRRITWKELMSIAHALEDYFTLRTNKAGGRCCEACEHWVSISEASPHLGKCNKKSKRPIHAMGFCKGFSERRLDSK